MRTRLLAILSIAILAFLGGWAGIACGDGGGGELTLEEFFAEVQALDDELEERSNELDAQFDEEGTVEQAIDLLEQQGDLIDEFIDGIEDLNPPDEAADLQDEAVSAGREAAQAFQDILDSAADAASLDELFALFDTAETNPAFERFDEVCLDAEALAADNGISVDFSCEQE
jgi:hypothetical protein